ncbi:uncharacterized protein CIMG_04704 [Coccidioides immitis RS]|uniref:Uncharacterized protein n=1 Tax=Coccidioides immitis (strain RS) TaxID=246410 RepID=J3KE18_COCIM|nr:uncharacterized protein CIMG_04704 [Coccidioides immitis RS]EAS33680.3 hypothetical protein CIMG_04704 [Coccidioides immitis RS]
MISTPLFQIFLPGTREVNLRYPKGRGTNALTDALVAGFAILLLEVGGYVRDWLRDVPARGGAVFRISSQFSRRVTPPTVSNATGEPTRSRSRTSLSQSSTLKELGSLFAHPGKKRSLFMLPTARALPASEAVAKKAQGELGPESLSLMMDSSKKEKKGNEEKREEKRVGCNSLPEDLAALRFSATYVCA